MREIKFRVFDLQTDKMYKVVNIDFVCGLITATETDSVIDLIQLPFDSSGFSILESFTGLKDNNGKEIYEGDVVHMRSGEEHQGFREFDETGIVKFSNGSFSPVYNGNVHCDFGYIEEIEIIGNIHENPELLKN